MEKSKAQQALEFVKEQASRGLSATDLHNVFFGNGGELGKLFPERAEREAFFETEEYRQIYEIRQSLRAKEKAAS